jgi:predicted Na+-dependent transporter
VFRKIYFKFRTFGQSHFGFVLAAAFVIGFFFPALGKIPSEGITVILSVVIFMSCFSMKVEDLLRVRPTEFVLYYIARFLLFPAFAFCISRMIYAKASPAILLLCLMPAGVSSTAFSAILGGNVPLSLFTVAFTTLVTPLVVPTILTYCLESSFHLDSSRLFFVLAVTLFLPMLLYIPLRKNRPVNRWISANGSFLSVVAIGATIAIVISKYRNTLIQDPMSLFPFLGTAFLLYAALYLFGFLFFKAELRTRISYCVCSGANNIALAISLSLLYFPPETSLFLVLSEIPWVMLLVPFRQLERRIA